MCMHNNEDNSRYYIPKQSAKTDYSPERESYSNIERGYN